MEYLLSKIVMIPAILIAFVAQGYARAKVADYLGDKTPRFQGRLSLNPLAHIDLYGFLMIIITEFGWTKPVITNPAAYKRGYKDEFKVSIAAPIANLIVAFVGMFIYMFWIYVVQNFVPTSIYGVGYYMLYYIILININLAIFTLIPLPGLVGFDLFKKISPKNFYKYSEVIYRYQLVLLVAVVLFGQYILIYPVALIYNLFYEVVSIFFGIFI